MTNYTNPLANTYRAVLDSGKIVLICGYSARDARTTWASAHNEKIISIRVCKEAAF